MSIGSELAGDEEEEEVQEAIDNQAPAYHPTAPSHELFDVSTTVDPSYIISLIRKLLPPDLSNNSNISHGVDACAASDQGSKSNGMEESVVSLSVNRVLNGTKSETEAMGKVDDFDELAGHEGGDDGSCDKEGGSVGEQAWEEYGCILWDLAATKTHAEFMVQNLILEVLLATLRVSQSVRVMEISLGIIGNLACHDASRKQIVSKNELIEIIVDQLFLDDTPCLCEVCRLFTLGLQGSECVTWAEAMRPERVLCRILWVAENTLNPQLIEKSVGLLLAILESEQKVIDALLRPLMKLGLPNLLFNLLAFEMSKLKAERIPERYSVLDLILRTIEALSVIDDYSQEISSNKELFHLLNDLVKLPDKIEVANSCVTAAVLIANILTDTAELALVISKDSSFLQGLLDIFPLASDDLEARSALWNIITRLLDRVQECELTPSSLHQFVSVLVRKSDLIEEDLLDYQLDGSKEKHESLTISGARVHARTTALRMIISILTRWTTSKDSVRESNIIGGNYANDGNVSRLLECCRKYTESDRPLFTLDMSLSRASQVLEDMNNSSIDFWLQQQWYGPSTNTGFTTTRSTPFSSNLPLPMRPALPLPFHSSTNSTN